MKAALLISASLAILVFLMALLVRWARRRSRGAVVTGALLAAFAPDPTLETNLRLAEESKQRQTEEDEEGEPK